MGYARAIFEDSGRAESPGAMATALLGTRSLRWGPKSQKRDWILLSDPWRISLRPGSTNAELYDATLHGIAAHWCITHMVRARPALVHEIALGLSAELARTRHRDETPVRVTRTGVQLALVPGSSPDTVRRYKKLVKALSPAEALGALADVAGVIGNPELRTAIVDHLLAASR